MRIVLVCWKSFIKIIFRNLKKKKKKIHLDSFKVYISAIPCIQHLTTYDHDKVITHLTPLQLHLHAIIPVLLL